MTSRTMTYAEAIRDAQHLAMAADPDVYVMGLGVPDPKGIFGTTTGLLDAFGPDRVLDMPLAENGMTGVAIGSALMGMRPVLTHQRVDFAILSMEQLVNQAAKWRFMFGGKHRVPLVVRMVIGRGWGQGPQHSQSLQSWFAHIPGLQVVMPSTAADAKGLLLAAIESDDPVIYLEHRWLHHTTGSVPEGRHVVPIGSARVGRPGTDVTIAATSYMTIEALHAAEVLETQGVSCEVVDLRSLRPLDVDTIVESVERTGRLVAADTAWKAFGTSAEVVAAVTERAFSSLIAPPVRVALPDGPTPTSPSLAGTYYPRALEIAAAVGRTLGRTLDLRSLEAAPGDHLDQPDPSFTGPF